VKVLAIDTACGPASVALVNGTEVPSRSAGSGQGHAEHVLSLVDDLLAESGLSLSDLDALAFGRGPGSFTGLRVAASVIQGLALGCGLPVIPVSTLAALAHAAWLKRGWRHVLAALDARMGEIYWGGFEVGEDGQVQAVEPECLSAPEALVPVGRAGAWYGAGPGWESYTVPAADEVAAIDSELLPSATDVAALAVISAREDWLQDPVEALPVYLREQVAWKRGTR
jgi:tRNA threonylcarbamoyladenosine biosynthesis protein TsaB